MENIDNLIEIHPDFLDKIMKAPTLSKSELIFLLVIYFILDKERVAFLLKRSKPVRSERKDPKYIQLIYAYYLKILKKRKSRQGNDHSINLLLMEIIIWTLILDQKIEELLIHSDREQLQHNFWPQQKERAPL